MTRKIQIVLERDKGKIKLKHWCQCFKKNIAKNTMFGDSEP